MPLKACPAGVRVRLKVTPKAKRDAVGGLVEGPGGEKALKVSVIAAAEGGKANAAVAELLAREWGVAKSAISVVSGATGRRKLVEIRGPTQDLLARLQRWLARHQD